jgi:ElaA protein
MTSPLLLPDSAWLTRFDELTPHRLHALMALRQKVFAVEQQCAYLDADRGDLEALHLGFGEPPELAACGRIVLPTEDDPSASFGRIVTHPDRRGEGLGRLLVKTCLDVLEVMAPGVPVFIEAQAYLERFYGSFGFRTFGEPFLEDGIPHLHMERI